MLDLRPPANLVSRRAVLFWTTRAALGWLVPLIGELLWLVLGDGGTPLAIVLVVTAVLAVAHLIVMPQWRYRVHRWETSEQVVYTQSGWFNQERRIAPVSRIQTVDTERGPLERMFGLANLTVTTASARGPVHIHGLELDTAQRLAADLATRTQATVGDAT
ncbi:membrane protein [Amycolatopsis acidiphila]|uniref:PH domain-containing protein n=1 Tax=Amycolatopsis acidiphila TaxID=715473 RepID=A0A557ZP35_9PSEU|nr:PH domain-containing protein [Amycolatopsis acidiphila]GHG95867.1 membrane protein [Amycolatopsis acidiphila]